jgi:phenylalanyl-tRNA synthetase beta chain
MRIPLAWLRDYIDLDDRGTDHIVAALASLGFPVESVERARGVQGIVVGRITKLEKHPNADRLQVCTIDVGTMAPLTIATAATNVAQGQTIPVAVIGARVASPDAEDGLFTIAPRKMRGIDSQGMLCSAGELGLEASWFEDGILQLESDLSPGQDVIAHYGLNDDVLDVEITSNRVDVMSMIGVARELGARYGKPVREPIAYMHIPISSPDHATRDGLCVRLESADCRRFVAQRFSGVTVETAPAWMRVRLALAGQRPINNLVDISNFVMLELGQPLHFYDFEKLAGGCLIARDARADERLRTLDGEDRQLSPFALIIADAEQAQGLAGLKGGASSEISSGTREIALESASFVGSRIRRMSVRQGFRSDASARHEKGLPLELSEMGAARAAALLTTQGATSHEPFAVGMEVAPRLPITLPAQAISRVLGMTLSVEETERALLGLDFEVRTERDAQGEITYTVRPPHRRGDIAIVADVIEEIARIIGYDRIEPQLPPVLHHAIPSDAYDQEERVADALATLGYYEINTLALQPASVRTLFADARIPTPHPLEIQNPLSEDQRFLRFSLLPGLLELVARRQHNAPLRFFEIGHIFEAAEPDPFEVEMVAWLLALPPKEEPAWSDAGFLDHKGDTLAFLRTVTGREAETVTSALAALHPGKTASLVINGKDIVTIGAVDPRLLAAYAIEARVYCGFARLRDMPAYRLPTFHASSRFPAVERDLAITLAPEIPAHDVVHAIRADTNSTLRDIRVFDEYRGPQIGENRKSLTIRVKLQRNDATLTDEEAEASIQRILTSLRERVGAEIRTTSR